MARKMTAKYPGCCRGCGEGIDPGDSIVHAGKRKNYHAGCYDGAAYSGPVKRAANDGGNRERAAANAEYAAGVADAASYRFNRDTFGEDYAAAEEFAWGLKTGEGW